MTAGANATTDAAYPTACKWCRAELIDESPTWLLFACNSGFFRKRAGEDAAWERDEKCWSAEIAALHARIAELEEDVAIRNRLNDAAIKRFGTIEYKHGRLRDGVKAQAKTLMNLYAVACDDDGPYGGWVVADAVSEVAAELTALLGQDTER